MGKIPVEIISGAKYTHGNNTDENNTQYNKLYKSIDDR